MGQRYIEQWTADDVAALRVRQVGTGYGLYVGKDQLTTPAGNPLVHPLRSVVYALLQEAWMTEGLDVTSGGYYSLYCTEHDLIAASWGGFVDGLPHLLTHHEVITRPMAGPEYIEQVWAWRSVSAWLAEHGCTQPLGYDLCTPAVSAVVRAALLALDPAQQTAVMSLCTRHHASVLLPLMVVLGECTPDEYADGCLIGAPIHPIFGMGEHEEYREAAPVLAAEAMRACAYVTLTQRGG